MGYSTESRLIHLHALAEAHIQVINDRDSNQPLYRLLSQIFTLARSHICKRDTSQRVTFSVENYLLFPKTRKAPQ